MTLALRDELEAIIRGWNAHEIERGAAPVIDFDFRPDIAEAAPISSRLDAWCRCNDILAKAEQEQDPWVARRAQADVTYLGALLGEQLPLPDYIRRTQGCEAAGWPDDYVAVARDRVIGALGELGVGWGPTTMADLTKQQGPITVEQAELEIRQAVQEFEPALRQAAGSTAEFNLSIETANVDAYWAYWLDGAGSDVRLRLNLRHAGFTHTRARQFALHEVLGHGLQSASIARYCSAHEVPWVRLLSVHTQQETLFEGLAQVLPLLIAPDDPGLRACVYLDHFLQLVRGNLHVAINRAEPIDQCAAYAGSWVPYWGDDQISDALTDRTVNPLLRSYLWAYPAGIDWFIALADGPGPVSAVLERAYREPLTPDELVQMWPEGPSIGGLLAAADDNAARAPVEALATRSA